VTRATLGFLRSFRAAASAPGQFPQNHVIFADKRLVKAVIAVGHRGVDDKDRQLGVFGRDQGRDDAPFADGRNDQRVVSLGDHVVDLLALQGGIVGAGQHGGCHAVLFAFGLDGRGQGRDKGIACRCGQVGDALAIDLRLRRRHAQRKADGRKK